MPEKSPLNPQDNTVRNFLASLEKQGDTNVLAHIFAVLLRNYSAGIRNDVIILILNGASTFRSDFDSIISELKQYNPHVVQEVMKCIPIILKELVEQSSILREHLTLRPETASPRLNIAFLSNPILFYCDANIIINYLKFNS